MEKLYCVLIDGKELCWFGNEPYQHRVTDDLEEAKGVCLSLRERHPNHDYTLHQVTVSKEIPCKN